MNWGAIKVVGEGTVYLQAHYTGDSLPRALRNALIRGACQWDAPQYLARVIFDEMIGGRRLKNVGYGISGELQGGGEDRTLTVDCMNFRVTWPDGSHVTFEEYIALADPSWDRHE